MKICYIAADVIIPFFGGASTHVHEVAKYLTLHGHEVHVISRRIWYNQQKHEMIDGFHVHRIYRGMIAPLPISSYRRTEVETGEMSKPLHETYAFYLFSFYAVYAGIVASRIIKRYDLDIILERETSFGAGAVASIISKRPMILEVIGPRYSKHSLKKAEKIIAYTKVFLRDYPSLEKLELVTAAANVENFRPQPDKGKSIREKYGLQGLPVIGYVGTFAKWHGIDDLIRASRIILENKPAARFLMVGPHFRYAKELAKRLGVSYAFVFTGPVPYINIPSFINAADILVAPFDPAKSELTREHGFVFSPLKIFEYMACGKPVVTTSLELVTQVVQNGKTGIIINPGDFEALAQAVVSLIEDQALAKRIGNAARAVVERQYSWEAFATLLEKMLKDAFRSYQDRLKGRIN